MILLDKSEPPTAIVDAIVFTEIRLLTDAIAYP